MGSDTGGIAPSTGTGKYEFFVIDEPQASFRLSLPYDIHVRPANHLHGALRNKPWFDRVSIRRDQDGVWTDFEPLSLLALALERGETVRVRVTGADATAAIREVAEAFETCPRFRSYEGDSGAAGGGAAVFPTALTADEAMWEIDFRRQYASNEPLYRLLKMYLANFILMHVVEVETCILTQQVRGPGTVDWDKIGETFQRLLFGDLEKIGILSPDMSFDNLLQIRKMCYHQMHRELEQRVRLTYEQTEEEWSRTHARIWRRRQNARYRFFYEQENVYYRDLFLLTLVQRGERLSRFLQNFGWRIEEEIRTREEVSHIVDEIRKEFILLGSRFDDAPNFMRVVDAHFSRITREAMRFLDYFRLIRDRRIYQHTDNII